MSDFLEFTCPACNRAHLVDGSELPVEGAWRACPSCGTQVHVTRDGSGPGAAAESYPDLALAEEPGESLALYLKMPGGTIERLSTDALGQGIQMRRVLPWDLASGDSREFQPVSEYPEFRSLFLPGDFQPVAQPRCVNHPGSLPAGTCRRCGRSYCEECAQKLFRIQPKLCPACNGVVAEPDRRLREAPPWQRPKEVVRFPIEDKAWIGTVGLGALFWIVSRSLYLLPLYLLAIPILLDAVLRSSRGARRWSLFSAPPGPSGTDLRALLREALPVAFLSAILAIPFLAIPWVLGPSVGVLAQFPMTLLLYFYYPMAVALVLVTDDKDRALKPKTVLRGIWALRDEYFAYLALFIAIAVGVVAAVTLLSFLPFIAPLLQSMALAYGWVLSAHVLGFFIFMNRERLRAAI